MYHLSVSEMAAVRKELWCMWRVLFCSALSYMTGFENGGKCCVSTFAKMTLQKQMIIRFKYLDCIASLFSKGNISNGIPLILTENKSFRREWIRFSYNEDELTKIRKLFYKGIEIYLQRDLGSGISDIDGQRCVLLRARNGKK